MKGRAHHENVSTSPARSRESLGMLHIADVQEVGHEL